MSHRAARSSRPSSMYTPGVLWAKTAPPKALVALRPSLIQQRLLGVSRPKRRVFAILERPACVEHGTHEAPVNGTLPVKAKLSAQNVQATPVHTHRHPIGIHEKLTHIETPVAHQTFGVDGEPIGPLGPEDIKVVEVAMQHDIVGARGEQL